MRARPRAGSEGAAQVGQPTGQLGRVGARVEGLAHQDGELVAEGVRAQHGHRPVVVTTQVGRLDGQQVEHRAHPGRRRDAVGTGPLDPLRAEAGQTLDDPAQLARRVVGVVQGGQGRTRQSLPRRIAIRRSISMYSHTSVTSRPKAATHAICCGTPAWTPRSM